VTIVDLRSDTVTRPTPAMREAIASAEVGDDVFGDDPTVRLLEEKVARILGKEASLYVPSGTMANEIAVAAHTERGDEIILEAASHVFLHEGAGPAVLSGVQAYPVRGDRGLPSLAAVESALRPSGDSHFPRSRLLILENTHNKAGGRILPKDRVEELCRFARSRGLRTHLDGARLWNAAAATGIPEIEWALSFDSVGVCLSKGLGAPVGSLLAGDASFIAKAHQFRKRFGGGMRQAGILAAAGLYALEHHRDRLREDHARARRLAEALASVAGLRIEPADIETNIVYMGVDPAWGAASRWVEALAAKRIRVTATGPLELRAVTHLDVDDEGIDRALRAYRDVSAGLAKASP
jgi:threonine aldolase